MGLFDEPLRQIRRLMDRHRSAGALRRWPRASTDPWRGAPEVILRDQARLELGRPGTASRALLLWEPPPTKVSNGRISLVGPDFTEDGPTHRPLAQVLMVAADLENVYDDFCALRERTYQVGLRGQMVRVLPSRQRVWYRLTGEALDSGLGARALGSALIDQVLALDAVTAAEVLFITADDGAIRELAPPAEQCREIIAALVKMHEDLIFDCEGCEFSAVCDSVTELRDLHQAAAGAETNRRQT